MKKRTFLASLLSLPALAFMPKRAVTENNRRSTAIKDKNGREIFEGDIVIHESISHYYAYGKHTITPFYISFVLDDNSLVYCLTRKDDGPIFNIWEGDEIEVLGNIHDNPELMQERHLLN